MATASDLLELWRLQTLQDEGRLYTGSSLELDIAQRYDKATARLTIGFKNVSAVPVGQIRVSVPGHGLPIQEHIEVLPINELPTALQSGEEAKHHVQVQCHGPFAHPPAYVIHYVEASGNRVKASLVLPTIMTKFVIPSTWVGMGRFMQMFESFGASSETVVVATPLVSAERWKDYLERAFHMHLLPESLPGLSFATGELQAGTPGQSSAGQVLSVPCAVMLALEESGSLMRIAVRSQYGSLAAQLAKILECHLMTGEKSSGGRLRHDPESGQFSSLVPLGLPTVDVEQPPAPLTEVSKETAGAPTEQMCEVLREERDNLLEELRRARRQASKEQAMLSMELPKKRQVRFDPEVNTPVDFQFTMAALRDVQEERGELLAQLKDARDMVDNLSAELKAIREAGGPSAPAASIEQRQELVASREEAEKLMSELSTSKELLQQAMRQMEGFRNERDAALSAQSSLRTQMAEERGELVAQLDAAKAMSEILRADLQTAREAPALAPAVSPESAHAEEQLVAARAQIESLENELRVSKEMLQQAHRHTEELQNERDRAVAAQSELQNKSVQERRELICQLEGSKAMADSLRVELRAAQEAAQSSTVSAEQENQLAAARSEVSDMSRELKSSTELLQQARREVDDYRAQRDQAVQERSGLAQQLQSANDTIQRLSGEVQIAKEAASQVAKLQLECDKSQAEQQELRRRLAEATADSHFAQTKLVRDHEEKLREEQVKLLAQVEALRAERDEAMGNHRDATATLERAQLHLDLFSTQAAKDNTELLRVRAACEAAVGDVERLQKELSVVRPQMEALQAQRDEAVRQEKEVAESLGHAQTTLDGATRQVAKDREELDALQSSLETSRLQSDKLQEECFGLRAQLETVQHERDAALKTQRQTASSLEKVQLELESFSTQASKDNADCLRLRSEMETVNADNVKLKEELSLIAPQKETLQAERDDAMKKAEVATHSMEQLQGALERVTKQASLDAAELENMRSRAEAAQTDMSKLIEEGTGLRAQLQTLQAERDTAAQQELEAKRELHLCRSQAAEDKAELARLQSGMAAASADIQRLQQDTTEVGKLRSDLQVANADIEKLREEHSKLAGQAHTMKAEWVDALAAQNEIAESLERAQQTFDVFSTQAAQDLAVVKTLRSGCEVTHTDIKKLTEEQTQLVEQMAALRAERDAALQKQADIGESLNRAQQSLDMFSEKAAQDNVEVLRLKSDLESAHTDITKLREEQAQLTAHSKVMRAEWIAALQTQSQIAESLNRAHSCLDRVAGQVAKQA
eukprot:CAMPEP_0178392534 /NCGR_PEP_ID=MMETSP0689_2-20121128/11727_1 /TAXON_ID=160604 /ORGANISM="Amphidinium massartii, Strain CS-259" /LENGTH=1281 /DNA_ID=CAMNT_0020013109 /DNA_START=74 /DNA_END=3919 /DNA_ORIENTATION=+